MKNQKLKTVLVFICVAMLTVIALVQTTFAKYVIKKDLVVAVTTADYYFKAEAEETEYKSSEEVEVIVNLANYEGEAYTEVDIEYAVNISNDKYDIAIVDASNGVIAGGAKKDTQIKITLTPKENAELTPEEIIKLEITTSKPYVETKEIEIKIDTRKRYEVTYDANGGEGAPEAQEKIEDEDLELSTTIPTRTGYTFKGWATTNDATEAEYTVGADGKIEPSYSANQDVTLYAVWEVIEYTITYTLNNGIVAGTNPSTYTVESDDITLINPTKVGYTFIGWTGSNGALPELTVTIAKGSTGNKLYTANWELNAPTVELLVENADINLFDDVTTTFTAKVTDTAEETYQWYYNGTEIEGAETKTYSISTEEMTESNYQGGTYKVEVTNGRAKTELEVEQTVERTVSSAEQMKNFAVRVNEQAITFAGDTVKQLENIDLSSICGASVANWTPIGTETVYFKGTYDGNSNEISNLYINQDSKYLGLFGVTEIGTIQNLVVSGNITTNDNTSLSAKGGIVARKISGTIRDCANKVNITANISAGGIVGRNESGDVINCENYGQIGGTYIGGIVFKNDSTISNCANYGQITGDIAAGVCYDNNKGTISNCINKSTVKGRSIGGVVYSNTGTIYNSSNSGLINVTTTRTGISIYGGGIVCSNNGTIENCANTGNVIGTGTTEQAGVIVGGIISVDNTNSVVKKCYNSGTISADCQHEGDLSAMSCAGGIVGYDYRNGTIENCYNTGNISTNKKIGDNTNNAGGIVAYINCNSTTVKNCYSTGTINATREDEVQGKVSHIGGVVGQNVGTSIISNTYYLQDSVTGGKGGIDGVDVEGQAELRTADYMKTGEFVDLLNGGEENWQIVAGKNNGYPVFGWQYVTYTITYDLAGGTIEGTKPEKYIADSEDITLPIPTKAGYTFIGWTGTDLTEATQTVTIPTGSTGNRAYTANWEAKTVKVTFMRNINAEDTVSDEQTFTYDVENQAFTDKGWSNPRYVLLGWALEQDSTVKNWNITSEVANSWINNYSPEVTLYAVWEEAVATTETTGYASLSEAMSGATTGQTITMLKNSTETAVALNAAGKTVTLDLAGKTVTYSGSGRINNRGTLTITDPETTLGKITVDTTHSTHTILNYSTGNLTIEKVAVENAALTSYQALCNEGTATIKSGTIANVATTAGTATSYAIVTIGDLTIEGGEVLATSCSENTLQRAIAVGTTGNLKGTLNVTGGTITSNGNAITNRTTVNITGGTISTLKGTAIQTLGELNITGGTVTSSYQHAVLAGSETINNEEINGKITVDGDAVIQKSGTTSGATFQVDGNATAELKGGTIQTLEGSSSNAIYASGQGTIKVDGATILQLGNGYGGTNAGSGTIEVLSGTITGAIRGLFSLSTSTGTIIVGTNDGTVSTEIPSITGGEHGIIMSGGTLNFYDGVIKGTTAISAVKTNTPTGYSVKTTTANGIQTATLSNKYTVTYNATQNGGTTTATAKEVAYGNSIDLTPTATKSGYEFVGWNTSSSATTGLSSLKVETSNVTLYAIFKKEITATFNYYNASKEVTGIAYNNATTATITAPGALGTPSGYTFRGWSTSATANATTTLTSTGSATLSADATYYASYGMEVTATYYYNSGNTTSSFGSKTQASATAKGTRYMSYTGAVTNSAITIPTAVTSSVGYALTTYAGIATASSSGTAASSTTANTTYYAYYESSFTYYYYNGSAHTSTAAKRYLRTNGTQYVSTVSSTPSPSAYDSASFKGWSSLNNSLTDGNGVTAQKQPAETSATALYAFYQKSVTATFYYNNGSAKTSATASGTRTYISKSGGINTVNGSIAIPSAVSTNRTINSATYTYKWVTTATTAAGTSVTPTTASTTYYAVYTATATFYSGSNKTTKTATQYYNAYGVYSISAPAPAAITSWTTLGWRNDGTAGAKEYGASTASTIAVASTTYYAVYSRSVTVAYNGNGATSGSVASESKTQYYNSNGAITSLSFTLKANGFTKTGYTFSKWAAGSASGTQYAAGTAYAYSPAVGTTTVTQTMYAVWAGSGIAFTRDSLSGTGSASVSSNKLTLGGSASNGGGYSGTLTATIPAGYTINYTASGSASYGGANATISFDDTSIYSSGSSSTSFTKSDSYTTTASGTLKLYINGGCASSMTVNGQTVYGSTSATITVTITDASGNTVPLTIS